MKDLIIIAALAKNKVIGNKGKIPWKIKEDMRRFRTFTFGCPVIMGRKTYDSIPKKFRPLEGRTNIVISKSKLNLEGVFIYDNIKEAIEKGKALSLRTYVIGGQEIYEQTISLANVMELTELEDEYPGDALFPKFSEEEWERTDHIYEPGLRLYWNTYKRKE